MRTQVLLWGLPQEQDKLWTRPQKLWMRMLVLWLGLPQGGVGSRAGDTVDDSAGALVRLPQEQEKLWMRTQTH